MSTFDVSAALRARMQYRKFAGEKPRVLVGHSRYWVDDACLRAAEQLGWTTHTTPLLMEGKLSRDHLKSLFEALIEFKPDFILTANLAGMDVDGMLARFYADLEIPNATWFVDEPRSILMGNRAYASDYAVAFTWERAYIPYLEQSGFGEVHHLPLAADTALFDAEPATEWQRDAAFVGSSMTEFAARELDRLGQWPELKAAIVSALDENQVTREAFSSGLAAIIDNHALKNVNEHGRRQAELVCFIEATRRLRHSIIPSLANDGITVHGDPGWRDAGVKSEPPVDYAEQLPAFYRSTRINVNTTSIQMPTAVNQRVFDCPAAGGFVLTDAQADLETLFDAQNETVQYSTTGEAKDLLRHYKSHDSGRVAITRRARERILAEHTYEHRLRTMAALLKRRFGS